jgi:FkbM family methyltransferase
MRFKDLEFFIKKIIPEKYLLRKRLKRAIKSNYEKELTIVKKFSDKTKEAIDVGVYRGVYSYEMSKYFKFIHSFEPNPLIYPYLYKNLPKIIHNIKLYNIALSNVSGEDNLRIPSRTNSFFKNNVEELYRLGCATIHNENTFYNFNEFKVKKEKLDNLLSKNKIGFIKIDVEGHELEVIDGSLNLIMENKPILLVEIEEKHTKKKVSETITKINKLGYASYFFDENNLKSTVFLKSSSNFNNFIFEYKS